MTLYVQIQVTHTYKLIQQTWQYFFYREREKEMYKPKKHPLKLVTGIKINTQD